MIYYGDKTEVFVVYTFIPDIYFQSFISILKFNFDSMIIIAYFNPISKDKFMMIDELRFFQGCLSVYKIRRRDNFKKGIGRFRPEYCLAFKFSNSNVLS